MPGRSRALGRGLRRRGVADGSRSDLRPGKGRTSARLDVRRLGVGSDLDGAVDALADSYFAENGTIISLHEPTDLDGVPANITRVEGDFDATQTKAFITAFAPEPFTPGADTVQFFVIAIVTPYDNGEALIEQVVSTWRWA
ncbi:hypothetical protein ACFWI1_04800 [Cellulosimicrobium cellulans]|uniref:hypothetical protein n=1 Tax=Cellulosimicrobium cellulans TaxID=1710 RepID=UPI003665BC8D